MRGMLERRQFGRRQTFLHGRIQVAGRASLPCQVRNLSPIGAFLELKTPAWLPFQFALEIAASRQRLTCEVRHVRSNGIGVRIVQVDGDARQTAVDSILGVEIDAWRGPRR